MSWNHRVIYHKADCLDNNPDLSWDAYLAIHEVHYDENGDPISLTENPVDVGGTDGKDSLIGIKWTLEQMMECLNKPILDYETLQEIEKELQDEYSKSIEVKE